MTKNAKKIISITSAILILVIGSIAWQNLRPDLKKEQAIPNQLVEPARQEFKDAYAEAIAKAQTWQADAQLVFMNSIGTSNNLGQSDSWSMVFTSSSTKNLAYEVTIENRQIKDVKMVPYVGKGGEVKNDLISPEQAITKLRELKGKENIEVLGTELIWKEEVGAWYWGIKTPQSIISIKASK